MRASFWTIYKRGRFVSHGLSEEERMQQRERFGAACLALCLQHDPNFCREFVNQIGGLSRTKAEWLVDVDPYRERAAAWADILLSSGDSVIVIECKVRDDLGPKQDPWRKKDEFMREHQGYGWYFREEFPHKRRTYVTLTESRTDQPRTIKGTSCRAATWSRLRILSESSKWVKDLFFSLGNLDYPAFRSMKTENLHIENIQSTLACHEVLTSVALRLGLKDWKIEHIVDELIEEEGRVVRGTIGIEITGFRAVQRKGKEIQKRIEPKDKYKAWFGYGLDPAANSDTTSQSIWFYCGNQRAAIRVKKLLGQMGEWRNVSVKKGVKDAEKYFLQYRRQATGGRRDEEQFMKAIAPVIPEVGKE
jgi:hypothetical protein